MKAIFKLIVPAILCTVWMVPLGTAREAEALKNLAAEKFAELPAVDKSLDFNHIDLALLDSAVFHETNRRRAAEKLPALKYHAELREAARIQSRGMILKQEVSHTHPEEIQKTLTDRMKLLEISGRYFAENVAMVFGIRYTSGESVYSRSVDGVRVFSKEPGGAAIAPHSYRSFAVSLLDGWMDSPGHRKNILASEPEFLGISCLHDRAALGMDRFYCTQVFLAPFSE